jgi:predicted RNase H-like nuclease (RuvC/YqgF family)
MDMLTRNGDDVLVVWDAQRIESDVILRAGLSLAKALCVRKQRERDKKESNWEEVDAAVLAVEKEVNRIGQMKTWTETIQSHSGKLLDEFRKMTNNLEAQIAVLRESVETLKLS